MASTSVINHIENLRHQAVSRLSALQYDTCPEVRDIYLYHVYDYWYEGYRHNVWEENVSVYQVNDIPYCYDNDLRNTVFMDNLEVLVSQEKVWPFLLFVGGCAVPWSDITIVHDYTYSYIRIDNFPMPPYDDVVTASILYFPLNYHEFRYGEDSDILLDADAKGLYFDAYGRFIVDPSFAEIGIRFEILDDDIYFQKKYIQPTDKTLVFEGLGDGYYPTLHNIMLIDTDTRKFYWSRIEQKIENRYNGIYNIFAIKPQTDANPDEWSNLNYVVLFYNTNTTIDNSSRVYSRKEDLYSNGIIRMITETTPGTQAWSGKVAPLIERFDFDHYRQYEYDENIHNSIDYITKYDYRLWKDAVLQDSKILSFTYTGKEIKELADDKGYAHFSRKHSDLIEDVIMMWVNHKLYDYHVDISYTANTINIPTFGIMDEDHVEIVMFTECNNNILDVKVVKDYRGNIEPIYIHPEYNLEDTYIMSEDCLDPSYTVPISLEGRRQYIVDIDDYSVDDDNNYTIKFVDDYYSKKDENGIITTEHPLKIVPKKQFRYYRFKQKEGQYKIILPTAFNYCHDADRYMVFVNGRKIDRTEYTITIMNKYRPFDKLVLYVSTILDAGDYIDIFYLPEELKEKYTADTITSRGFIYLQGTDNYPRRYPLSKYTNMVFLNGYKVNPLDIKDVSMNAMIVNTNPYLYNEDGTIRTDASNNPIDNPAAIKSVNSLTILEYLKGDKDIMNALYTQSGTDVADPDVHVYDVWKSYINNLLSNWGGSEGYDTISIVFGELYKITNPEADFKSYFANLKSILYDVIVDYYLTRQEATTGSEFVMEFEYKYWEDSEDEESYSTRIILDSARENIDFSEASPTYNYVDENASSATLLDSNARVSDDTFVVNVINRGNSTKLITLFPDHDKLLDYYPRDDIYANPEDVLNGNIFISEDQSSISNIGFVVMNSNNGQNMGRTAIGVLGSTIGIPGNTFAPDAGMSFAEWNTESDGSGTSYNPGDTLTFREDLYLYAIWR